LRLPSWGKRLQRSGFPDIGNGKKLIERIFSVALNGRGISANFFKFAKENRKSDKKTTQWQ